MSTFFQNIQSWFSRHGRARTIVIVFLIALSIVELRSIFIEFHETYVRGNGYLSYRHGQMQRTPVVTTPGDIAGWMTFRYLNFVFKLPPAYLATELHISDKQYPNIQISRYARTHQIDSVQFLDSVQKAVASYTAPTL